MNGQIQKFDNLQWWTTLTNPIKWQPSNLSVSLYAKTLTNPSGSKRRTLKKKKAYVPSFETPESLSQGCFVPNLVEIGCEVLVKKILKNN